MIVYAVKDGTGRSPYRYYDVDKFKVSKEFEEDYLLEDGRIVDKRLTQPVEGAVSRMILKTYTNYHYDKGFLGRYGDLKPFDSEGFVANELRGKDIEWVDGEINFSIPLEDQPSFHPKLPRGLRVMVSHIPYMWDIYVVLIEGIAYLIDKGVQHYLCSQEPNYLAHPLYPVGDEDMLDMDTQYFSASWIDALDEDLVFKDENKYLGVEDISEIIEEHLADWVF